MKKYMVRMAALAVIVGVAVAFTSNVDAEDKKASVSDCMKCQQKMKPAVEKAAKDGKWDDAAKSAKTWLTAAKDMGSCTPPKGEAESWKKFSAKYLEQVEGVVAAVEKKDAEAVAKNAKVDCMGCHTAHRITKKK